jgi:hypothetical protein
LVELSSHNEKGLQSWPSRSATACPMRRSVR